MVSVYFVVSLILPFDLDFVVQGSWYDWTVIFCNSSCNSLIDPCSLEPLPRSDVFICLVLSLMFPAIQPNDWFHIHT